MLKFKHNKVVAEKIDNNGFESEGLITMVIPVNDPALKFVGDDEIVYKSLLFDIIEMREQDGYYAINAFMDIHENELNNNFIEHTKRSHSQDANGPQTLTIKSVIKDFTKQEFDTELYPREKPTYNPYFALNFYKSPTGNIFSPPPEV